MGIVVLALQCVLALRCILALPCILTVAFSIVLFLQAFSTLLRPSPQCMQSAAPVAKVGPLATVSGLLITQATRQYFTVWLAERLVPGLFGIAFPLPLYILVVGGCYSLACLQSSRLILFVSFFFALLYFNGFSLLLKLLLLFYFSLF